MVPDLIKCSLPEVKQVNNIGTICEAFNKSNLTMFSEVHVLLCLYLTMPVTTATPERTFSVLKRVKTYLRSTMTQQRLNNAMLLHIHKEATDELDLVAVACSLAQSNDRRCKYYGSYTS